MKSNDNFEMKRFFHFNRSWGFPLAVLCGQQERALCCRDTAQALQTRRLPQGSVCLESTRTHMGLLIQLSGQHCWGPIQTLGHLLPRFCAPSYQLQYTSASSGQQVTLWGSRNHSNCKGRAGRARVFISPRAALSHGPGVGFGKLSSLALRPLQSSLGSQWGAAPHWPHPLPCLLHFPLRVPLEHFHNITCTGSLVCRCVPFIPQLYTECLLCAGTMVGAGVEQ